MASRLGVSVGHTITLISPQGTPTAVGVLPRFRKFQFGALFDMGMSEYDSTVIFVLLEEAQKFFRMGTGVSAFEIFVDNPNQMQAPLKALSGVW